jgi:hypothetical protein
VRSSPAIIGSKPIVRPSPSLSVPWRVYGLCVSRRRPVFVLGLTVGDYLLWNWSLNGNHDVVALISGLSLPPLALVSFWLLAVASAELAGMLTRRRRTARATSPDAARRSRSRSRRAPARALEDSPVAARTAPAEPPSRKIAA